MVCRPLLFDYNDAVQLLRSEVVGEFPEGLVID
jgi:hypothetical protein